MPITDAFTGTNGTGIEAYSSSWAYMAGGTTNLQIQSNALAVAAVTVEAGARRTETGFPDDQYAQVTAVIAADDEPFVGVAVRCQAAGSGDYYGFYCKDSASQLFEFDGTTWTQLGLNGAGVNNTQTIRLTVAGTTLTPAVAGSTQSPPGAQTDATYSSGAPGVSGFNDGSPTTATRVDDFECSDVAGAAEAIRILFAMPMAGTGGGRHGGSRVH